MTTNPSWKDLFSTASNDYARYRPTYPPELYAHLASLAPARACAVDLATGNGQAALGLAPHFARVVALDASDAQLASAPACANVTYGRAPADATGLPDAGADLVTVAQALHWFAHDRFFAEARRLLRPGGVLGVWSYGMAFVTPAVDTVMMRLYEDVLGSYWEPERRIVEDGYRSIAFPPAFTELGTPPFEMRMDWDLPRLFGYFRTWSALKAFARARGFDPLTALEPEFAAAWGDAPAVRSVCWPLSLRAFRV